MPPTTIPERLDALASEFAELAPRERLELLLEFAEQLPPLPQRYRAERDAGEHRVPECQTPVYLWVELSDGRVRLVADVAPEAPTVKGFVAILAELFRDCAADEVLAANVNFVQRLSLAETLGMVRTRGLQAVAASLRRLVAQAVEQAV